LAEHTRNVLWLTTAEFVQLHEGDWNSSVTWVQQIDNKIHTYIYRRKNSWYAPRNFILQKMA